MNRYLLFLLAVATLLFTGCASNRDMARLMYSTEAEGGFLDGGGVKNYNYYVYNGSGERPVAYLALDKKYTLESQFWYPTGMSPALWKEYYRSADFLREDNYQARVILSSQSEKIGFMITRYYMAFAWLVEPGSSTVVVPPPIISRTQPEYFRWRRDDE